MSQLPNVVWFLIDAIRTYPTDQDLRGKLPVMDRFAKHAVEFTTCATTAPSTIMSITAMMTGLPAYFLARNYDDFRFDSRFYASLANVLKRHGYSSYAFLRGMETREKFRHLLDPVQRRFWAPHLRHGFKWTNEDLNLVLERVLHAGVPRPAFLFFHYNPQARFGGEMLVDPAVSDKVESAWDMLERADFTPDNTIFILCSDHGFPDPSTGLTTEWEAKHGLGHDLVLTDDNILIPLYIRYPASMPKQITQLVSSLDIFPTLLELARIPDHAEIGQSLDGASLVPLMEASHGKAYLRRFARCDTRLMFQTGRSTAIRSQHYKYIRYHDEYRIPISAQATTTSELFIDLQEDPLESKNLLLAEAMPSHILNALATYRSEFERTETRAVEFQINYFIDRHRDTILPKSTDQATDPAPRIMLIFEPDTAAYADIGLSAVAKALPEAEIDVLSSYNSISEEGAAKASKIFGYAKHDNSQVVFLGPLQNGSSPRYDLAIVFVQNPSAPIVRDLLNLAKTFRATRRYILDCNFNAYRPRRYWFYRLRALVQRLPQVLEEPTFLMAQVKLGSRFVAKHALSRLGLWEHWEEVSYQRGQQDE